MRVVAAHQPPDCCQSDLAPPFQGRSVEESALDSVEDVLGYRLVVGMTGRAFWLHGVAFTASLAEGEARELPAAAGSITTLPRL